MAVLRVGALPDGALAAAAQFHAEILPEVLTQLLEVSVPLASERGDCFVLIFPPADYTHRNWRLAAVQSLARDHAPLRINAIVSNSEPAIAATLAYIAKAYGVTGQLLELDDTGAG